MENQPHPAIRGNREVEIFRSRYYQGFVAASATECRCALDEIPSLASIGLHKLSQDREGQWAMKINGPWRLVFTFRDGDAYDVEIVDYY